MDGEELETANWGRSSAGDALRFRSASGVGCEFAWPIIMRGDTKLCAVPFNDSLNPADQACAGGETCRTFRSKMRDLATTSLWNRRHSDRHNPSTHRQAMANEDRRPGT
jgi:hypothetical protein